jgi:outer membrane protein assembly factor BamB
MIRLQKTLVTTLAIVSGVAVCGIAAAQFDGPAPLAWRWQQPSSVASNGAPLIEGDTIYVNLGSRTYAVDRATGNTKWKFPNGLPLEGLTRRSPVKVGDTLVIQTDQRKIFGVDPSNGAIKWTYNAPFALTSQSVAVGKFLTFAMEGYNMMTINTENGEPIYDAPYKLLDGIAGLLNSDGKDSVLFFDNRNQLKSVSVTTKKVNWKLPFQSKPVDGSVTIVNGTAYCYSGTFLVALNASSGNVRFQQPMKEPMIFSPEVGGGYILSTTREGKVYTFDEGGRPKSAAPVSLGSQPLFKPVVVGNKFVVSTANGAVSLIDPATSSLVWNYYIRPMNEAARNPDSGASGAPGGGGLGGGDGLGAAGGGGGGLGAPGGGGGRNGGGGGFGGGGGQQSTTTVSTLFASASCALAGKTLLVPASDGSMLAFNADDGVDLSGPTMKQSWPTAGDVIPGVNGQEFIFKIEDEGSGVQYSSVSLDIDGKPYTFDFGRDGFLTCVISSSKKNMPLSDGRHVINLSVKDWMGNETKQSFYIRIDNTIALKSRTNNNNNNNGLGGPGGGPGGGGRGG